MVNSVMAVPTVRKAKRDDHRSVHSDARGRNENKLFAEILEETTKQPEQEPAPMACQTTMYDRDSRLQNFTYLTREYHY